MLSGDCYYQLFVQFNYPAQADSLRYNNSATMFTFVALLLAPSIVINYEQDRIRTTIRMVVRVAEARIRVRW